MFEVLIGYRMKQLEWAALGLVGCRDLEKGFGRVLTFKSLSCCPQIHQLLEKCMVGGYTKQTTLLDYPLMWVPNHCFRANPNDAAPRHVRMETAPGYSFHGSISLIPSQSPLGLPRTNLAT